MPALSLTTATRFFVVATVMPLAKSAQVMAVGFVLYFASSGVPSKDHVMVCPVVKSGVTVYGSFTAVTHIDFFPDIAIGTFTAFTAMSMSRELVQLPSSVLLTRSVTVYKAAGVVFGILMVYVWVVGPVGAGLIVGLTVHE